MDLSSNNLSGKIPTSICSQPLTYLHLGNNNLSGELPLSLRNCKTLTTLDLGQNKISGNIPTWLAENLLNLQTLRLRSNMLVGDIPSNLGSLISLRVIDFANNHLSGTIPSSLGNLSATKVAHTIFDNKKVALMAYDKISMGFIDNNELLYMVSSKLLLGYMDNIKVNLKGRNVQYDKLLPLLIFIDLSSNELSGEIPEELVNLLYLQSLNLSRNHLTGRIPENINMLRWLESLDLSMNNFSGAIPSTMTMLSLLSHLNLSYNNFNGRIPYGGQLLSLPDPSIYVGNYDLCGFPLDKKCEASEHANKNEGLFKEVENDSETTCFYLSMVLGFISGCWIIWATLLLNNKWRFSLFNFVDDMCALKANQYVALMVVSIPSSQGASRAFLPPPRKPPLPPRELGENHQVHQVLKLSCLWTLHGYFRYIVELLEPSSRNLDTTFYRRAQTRAFTGFTITTLLGSIGKLLNTSPSSTLSVSSFASTPLFSLGHHLRDAPAIAPFTYLHADNAALASIRLRIDPSIGLLSMRQCLFVSFFLYPRSVLQHLPSCGTPPPNELPKPLETYGFHPQRHRP
ncbi:receptor-like protein EIX1 [Dioscorea cayenensis subsp. rotundata]|uniref:Receptor-like protein EIX1 n=1 Tax=Dioscorea cayennensis subsp. rotundata TaxID=55577 RepID=A0AB40C9B0_DIOCR|nr:receptor-like protein EIX1 [Dioscorea cayenensis subsp. rotundata]